MSLKSRKSAGLQAPFLAEFKPLNALWEGQDPPYPSEHSARWAMRKMRLPLADARAVAIHRNRIYVHPHRFAQVAEQEALNSYDARAQAGRRG